MTIMLIISIKACVNVDICCAKIAELINSINFRNFISFVLNVLAPLLQNFIAYNFQYELELKY